MASVIAYAPVPPYTFLGGVCSVPVRPSLTLAGGRSGVLPSRPNFGGAGNGTGKAGMACPPSSRLYVGYSGPAAFDSARVRAFGPALVLSQRGFHASGGSLSIYSYRRMPTDGTRMLILLGLHYWCSAPDARSHPTAGSLPRFTIMISISSVLPQLSAAWLECVCAGPLPVAGPFHFD